MSFTDVFQPESKSQDKRTQTDTATLHQKEHQGRAVSLVIDES